MSKWRNYLGYTKFDHTYNDDDYDFVDLDDEDEEIEVPDYFKNDFIIKIYEVIRNVVTSLSVPVFDSNFTHESVEDYIEDLDII